MMHTMKKLLLGWSAEDGAEQEELAEALGCSPEAVSFIVLEPAATGHSAQGPPTVA